MRLLLRADADARMGTGHLMRCLALAQVWREGGGSVTFRTACAIPSLLSRLREEGTVETVDGEPGGLRDADHTSASARGVGAQWVALDGYHFDAVFQARVRAGVRVLVIDDYGHAGRYSADVVLNQNLHASEETYRERAAHTRLLLGTRYALLRREFEGSRSPTHQQGPHPSVWPGWSLRSPGLAPHRGVEDSTPATRKVLITLGGADPENVTLKAVRALGQLSIPGLRAIVVTGAANPHRAAVESAASAIPGVEVRCDVNNMAELMAWADLAVAAGGTTTWERACLGLPSLVVVLADNQRPLAQATEAAGLGRNLGDGAAIAETTLARAMEQLLRDDDMRAAMSRRGPELVDGQGAYRVCRILEEACVTLRDATADDSRQLWEWANEPATRASSFKPGAIPWESHQKWLAERLADPRCLLLIAADGSGTNSLGQVRFDREQPDATISISLDVRCRGRGYGPAIIRQASREAFRRWPVGRIVAMIRTENESSYRAFLKAGFRLSSSIPVGNLSAHHLTLGREDACSAS